MDKKLTLLIFILLTGLGASTTFGQAFEVKIVGKGDPLLLIPGLTCSGEVWEETVELLDGHYTCHVVTIAGFAGVDAQEAVQSAFLETVLGDLEAYAKELPGSVGIIGHSIGGFMGMALGARLPEKVQRVVVVDSYPQLAGFMMGETVDYDQLKIQLAASRGMLMAIPDSAYAANQRQSMQMAIQDRQRAETVAQWGIDSDRATMIQAYQEVLLADIRDQLPAVRADVLVLQSFNSMPLSAEDWDALNHRQFGNLPHVRIERTDEAGHFIMYDAPDWYTTQIKDFLL